MPPEIAWIQICRLPPDTATNATLFPSGESAGDSSAPAMSVSRCTVTTCFGMRLTRSA